MRRCDRIKSSTTRFLLSILLRRLSVGLAARYGDRPRLRECR
jgi:hypothetical protein